MTIKEAVKTIRSKPVPKSLETAFKAEGYENELGLTAYDEYDNSVTFIQYQSGAMGLNLQKANKIVYFTLPLSSEHFEQSKKRTHRLGQTKSCFYYMMICENSIEEKILETLKKRQDYTERLFINNN